MVVLVKLIDKITSTGGRGCFIRVRVAIDITKPLCHGRVVHLEEGGKCGLPSSMRDCQTFSTGLVVSTTMTGNVACGLRVKGRYP